MQSWTLFALGSAFFAGLTAVLGRVGVERIPSNVATLIRTLVIALFLTTLITARREWTGAHDLPLRSLIFLILSGLATGLSWICYYRALQLGSASLVAPVDKLSLVFTILLAVAFLGERPTLWQYAGAALVTAGVLLTTVK